MTFAKILTATFMALSATTSFATTKCDHQGRNGLFANTNPATAKPQVVKTDTATTKSGTR